MPKTIQLRRYHIDEGELAAFVDWWREWMPPAREEAGFTIEFCYALPETSEFVWAVSTPTDVDEFRRREEAYYASTGRATAAAHMPACLGEVRCGIVEQLA